MTDDGESREAADEPSGRSRAEPRPDPSLHPGRDPGRDPRTDPGGAAHDGGASGAVDPASLTAADTEPVADDALADLVDALSTGDPNARKRAALALAERDGSDDDARTALRRAARDDDDPTVRQFAVEALAARAGDDGPALPAAEAATRDEDPWVRAEAVVALSRLAGEDHVGRFEELRFDDHEAVRRNAAIALSRRRDAVEELLALLDDPSDRVREWAARLLGPHADDERVAAALARTARDDPVDLVRAAAGRALELDGAALGRVVDGDFDWDAPSDVLNRRPDL